ncbi:MAG TPA: hypothetical protein VD735_06670 [Candidatus Saccharimonadales bacterium]|nr:hypothetical protein [Candidatus Saccharimonadales bacterium]
MKELYFVALLLVVAAFWTFVDRRFPSTRVPFLYQEKLWLNFLTNFVFAAIIGIIVWYVL